MRRIEIVSKEIWAIHRNLPKIKLIIYSIIEAFNSTSRYLDDLLNVDNPYFEVMVNQITVK